MTTLNSFKDCHTPYIEKQKTHCNCNVFAAVTFQTFSVYQNEYQVFILVGRYTIVLLITKFTVQGLDRFTNIKQWSCFELSVV